MWMHNGFVRVNDEKMSKSLGNFFTIRDVLKSTTPKWCASSSCARTIAAR
jgi:cysteinyl-tRNA synthetase